MKLRIPPLFVFAAVNAVGFSALAEPARAAPVEAVRAALAGIEDGPNEAALKQIPNAEDGLLEVAKNAEERLTTRARAVAMLGRFRSKKSQSFLKTTLRDFSAPESLRTRAALALASAFGADALPELEIALRDGDRWVRKAAARAVATLSTPEAVRVRKARLAVEHDAIVRHVLQRGFTE